jgi:hypothetical protein
LKPDQEMGVTAETIQFGNEQRCPCQPTLFHGRCEHRTIIALATLDLDMFAEELPVAAVQESLNRRALGLNPEAALALLSRRNPQV